MNIVGRTLGAVGRGNAGRITLLGRVGRVVVIALLDPSGRLDRIAGACVDSDCC